jgi:VanZ family protein
MRFREREFVMRTPEWLQTVGRAAAWTCVLALAFLSLVPLSLKPETGAPGQLNHIFAYFVTGAVIACAYPRAPVRIVLSLIAYGCVLETLQTFVPGRDPKPVDALSSGLGAVAGVFVGFFLFRLLASRLGRLSVG